MKVLHKMLIKNFLQSLVVGLMFFVLILEMVDLFANLWRYLNQDVSIWVIMRIGLYYLPKCISFAMPLALLFAISYTLGNLYANNELIAVFGSGFPLYRFVLPLILFGLGASFFWFFFEDRVVINTLKTKNAMSDSIINLKRTYSNSDVTVIGQNRTVLYNAEFFNDGTNVLSDLLVVIRDEEGNFQSRIECEFASWDEEKWILKNVKIYDRDPETGVIGFRQETEYFDPLINEEPQTFRRSVSNIDEMELAQARTWVEGLQKAGRPEYREALSEYYKRYSFAFTSLIVTLISAAIGGRFKKNILLLSLLNSLIIAVVYYVFQMVTMIMAKNGSLNPFMGAWLPFFVFTLVSLYLFRVAKT